MTSWNRMDRELTFRLREAKLTACRAVGEPLRFAMMRCRSSIGRLNCGALCDTSRDEKGHVATNIIRDKSRRKGRGG